AFLGSDKTYGEQRQFARENSLSTLNLFESHTTFRCLTPLDLHYTQAFQITFSVANKLLGENSPLPFDALFMRRRRRQHHRPQRPGVIDIPLRGRLRQQFYLRHALGTLTVRSPNAIRSCITTTDNNDVLSRSENLTA